MYIYVTRGWNNNKPFFFPLKKKKKRHSAVATMGQHWRHEAENSTSQSQLRVQSWAARTATWAGSGWMGASSGLCDLAGVSLGRSAKQTSACHRVSSEGRHTCCSHFLRYAPWICSWGCTSPSETETHTHTLVSMILAGLFMWFTHHFL